MATPIYTGFWHDYTQTGAYGWTLTLSVKWSAFLLAALSTFVAIVGGCFWSLLAFAIHQWRVHPGDDDGVYFQQQAVYRNSMSPWSVIIELLRICAAWRSRRGRRAAPRRLGRRTFLSLLPPLLVVIGFTAAGIFVGDVTRPTYESNNVKIRPTNCGFVIFNNTESQDVLQAVLLKYVNDTQAARAYARSCYSGTATPAACSEYTKQSLPYSQTNVACPFGTNSNGNSLCTVDKAFSLDTGLLDTSDYLGVNAPKQDRLLFRRSSICSPINSQEYAQVNNFTDSDGFVIWNYFFGPIARVSNFTYQYNTHTADDPVTYQITSFTSVETWTPIQPLIVNKADTALFLLASNAVEYLTPVTDPWFSATKAFNLSGVGLANVFYKPDQVVNGLACIDQYQLCTSPDSCTVLGSIEDIRDAYYDPAQLSLNDMQNATALRLLSALTQSSIPNIVQYLSTSSLFASDRLTNLISASLPPNQWQIEVQGWFETSLAKIQALVTAYPSQPADLEPYGRVLSPNRTVGPIDRAAYSLCQDQRVRNTGSYQSFSALGLLIILILGTTIIILSLSVESCVATFRKRRRARYARLATSETESGNAAGNAPRDHREIARIADRMLQLQRMALLAAKPGVIWAGRLEPVPYTEDPEVRFALPVRVSGEDFSYGSSEDVEAEGRESKESGREETSSEGGIEEIQDDTAVPLPEEQDEQEQIVRKPEQGDQSEQQKTKEPDIELVAVEQV